MASESALLRRRAPGHLLGLTAALFSLGMIIQSRHQIVAVFELADPTGFFGVQFAILGRLANVSVILVFAGLMRRDLPSRLPSLYGAVFALKLVEAASLLPCFIGKPGALCGVASVLVSEFASPVILVLTVILILTSKDRMLRFTGLATAIIIAATASVAYSLVTPKTAGECGRIQDVAGRSACFEKFAVRQNDVNVCGSVELRSSRFECIRKIAEQRQRPDLCELIHDPPGSVIAAYETPDLQTRSLCYYVLAFNLKAHDLCVKIEVSDQRDRCLAMIPEIR